MTALVWLRSDLRSKWHSPIDYGIANHDKVIAVYCIPQAQWTKYNLAQVKIDLIYQRLAFLKEDLKQRNITLRVLHTDSYDGVTSELLQLCEQENVSHIYCNEYEWDERQRDKVVKQACNEKEITLAMFHDTCLVKPSEIMNLQNTPYKVFTPYFKRWLEKVTQQLPGVPEITKAKDSGFISSDEHLHTFNESPKNERVH